MAIMTREGFLQAQDRPVREVDVPGLGTVLVREMDAGTWGRLAELLEGQDTVTTQALMCAAFMVDEQGERLFAMENEADVELLKGKSLRVLQQISAAGMRASRISPEDVARDEENFTEAPGADSPSA